MRVFWVGFFLFLLLFASSVFADTTRSGATKGSVPVVSAVAGIQIVPSFNRGCTLTVDEASSDNVYFFRLQGVAATAITSYVGGFRLSGGANKDPGQYELNAQADGWNGQILAILKSGVGPVAVGFNCW